MYICLASHLGRFLLREQNRSFKTTLGSTTRLRDIFMHVVLIKKHTWPRGIVRADEEFDVTKKKSQDRLGSLQACLLQAKPTTIVSKFSVQKSHHHEKNVQQKIFFIFNVQKLQTDAANCEIMLKTPSRHSFVKLNEVCLHILSFDENQDFDL